jgi:hypothetical protein
MERLPPGYISNIKFCGLTFSVVFSNDGNIWDDGEAGPAGFRPGTDAIDVVRPSRSARLSKLILPIIDQLSEPYYCRGVEPPPFSTAGRQFSSVYICTVEGCDFRLIHR